MAAFAGKDNVTSIDHRLPELKALVAQMLYDNITLESQEWLNTTFNHSNILFDLQAAFTQMPRKTGKRILTLKKEQIEIADQMLPFPLEKWTVDRLGRVFLLLHVDPQDKASYTRKIESLFIGAEINESVALYSALPLLYYPNHWIKYCAEGIRSNIAVVLESIMYENPYPAAYLDEPAWNQMILKAFFTEKQVQRIEGLDARCNADLVTMLMNYAHERWAAHRTVDPMLWRCTSNHITEKNFEDIQNVFASENKTEVAAVALACSKSTYPPAIALLTQHPVLKNGIVSGQITWNTIAERQIIHSF